MRTSNQAGSMLDTSLIGTKDGTVIGSTNLLPDEGDVGIEFLKRYIDQLAPSVRSITVNDDGLLVSVSSDLKDDVTNALHYPRFCSSQSLQDCSSINFSDLKELHRLGPKVDLVSYVDENCVEKEVIFKYSMIFQFRDQIWSDMHITKGLPKHPNLVPFDRVVIDDVESRVIGFTTAYIPGGTLADNKSRTFKLAWAKQLTSVVDLLNLDLGIVHQDIAPHNLLVDPETDNLRLFDFDRAAKVSEPYRFPRQDDIHGAIFAVYEIITHDDYFQDAPYEERDPEAVLGRDE
ncbi:hypothetical protein MBLNU459_g0748t1 [Dothideomycetes sp. NU459]